MLEYSHSQMEHLRSNEKATFPSASEGHFLGVFLTKDP